MHSISGRRVLVAASLLAAATACGPTGPGTEARPVFLSPTAGSVVRWPRVEVAIAVPENTDSRLRVTLDGRDVSERFHPPFRRMRALGGSSVTVTVLDLTDHPAGEVRLQATLESEGIAGPRITRAFRLAPPKGSLRVRVLSGGRLSPARLHVEGRGATPDPVFETPGAAQVDPRERGVTSPFIDSVAGEELLRLPTGRYLVTASRGIEYDVSRREVDVQAERVTDAEMTLEHVAPTPGWISADLHVHAAPSVDSFVPLDLRVAEYAAAGVEILVGSDHHMLTDYTPVLATTGRVSDHLVSMIGVEAGLGARAGESAGHWTLFPFEPAPGQPVRPWPRVRAEEPADIYRVFHEGDPEHPVAAEGGIIELNHPRGIITVPGGDRRGVDGAAWFESSGFDPGSTVPRPDEVEVNGANAFLARRDRSGRYANGDFDALEVLNRFSLELYAEVRADWFALLGAGRHATATANSDSHHRVMVGPGFPRNLVRVGEANDRPPTFDRSVFLDAIRRGAVVGTTGPLIDVSVNGRAGPGEVVSVGGGTAKVRVVVRAAPWIPVREVRLTVDGETVERRLLPVAAQASPVRLDTTLEVNVRDGSWLVVEAGDPLEEPAEDPGEVYGLLAPGFAPLAFTNPVRFKAAQECQRSPPERSR